MECAGNSAPEVKYCSNPTCSLWRLRFGMRFRTALKNMDKDLFEPSHFYEDGKFCWEKTVTDIEAEYNRPNTPTDGLKSSGSEDNVKKRRMGHEKRAKNESI